MSSKKDDSQNQIDHRTDPDIRREVPSLPKGHDEVEQRPIITLFLPASTSEPKVVWIPFGVGHEPYSLTALLSNIHLNVLSSLSSELRSSPRTILFRCMIIEDYFLNERIILERICVDFGRFWRA
ncbi:hypothetical protein Fot_42302 [Forsythia ovata]|uniref:Uncharacterized protein n=1 Tax=Forsythia ovata TaxID=205694 RepID=A0ABD1RKS4_9LAMI